MNGNLEPSPARRDELPAASNAANLGEFSTPPLNLSGFSREELGAHLNRIFQKAVEGEATNFSPSLDVSHFVKGNGMLGRSFPTIGGSVGLTLSVGLPKKGCKLFLERVERPKEGDVISLLLEAEDNKGARTKHNLIINPKLPTWQSIRTISQHQQDQLLNLYKIAKAQGRVMPSQPIDMSALIQIDGKSSSVFPLPDGEKIGKQKGAGFPKICNKPMFNSVEYRSDGTFLLRMSCIDKYNKSKLINIVVVECPSEKDRIQSEADYQIANTLKLFQRLTTAEEITPTPPVDISHLVRPNATLQKIFPTLEGKSFGSNIGIGLTTPSLRPHIVKVERVGGAASVCVHIASEDELGNISSVPIYLRSNINEGQKIISQEEYQVSSLRMIYSEAARSSPQTLSPPLSLSSLINEYATARTVFPLPGGRRLEKQTFIGLPVPALEPQLERIRTINNSNDLELTISCKDTDGKRHERKFVIDNDPDNEVSFLKASKFQELELRKLYRLNSSAEPWTTSETKLNISNLVGRDGHLLTKFPLPCEQRLASLTRVGIPPNSRNYQITSLTTVKPDQFILRIEAEMESGEKINRFIEVSPDGIVLQAVDSGVAVDAIKGEVLDRFVNHLLANTQTSALASPFFQGSLFTDERFYPNAISGDTLIHSKWGNRGDQILTYMQKYGRLKLIYPSIRHNIFLVASEDRLDQIREIANELGERIPNLSTSVFSLMDFAKTTLEIPESEVVSELNTISSLAALNQVELLSRREYQPTLNPSQERAEKLREDDFTRIARLANSPDLINSLRHHLAIHSPYWEREYHINLAFHCSYLIDRCLGQSSHQVTLRQEVQDLVYQLYPELKMFPQAWVKLMDKRKGGEAIALRDGGGAEPRLKPFDLLDELSDNKINAPRDENTIVELEGVNQLPQLSPKLAAVFARYGSIEEIFAALNELVLNSDSSLHSEIRATCMAWISTLFLDIRVNDSLPAELSNAKNSRDPGASFYKHLMRLAPDQALTYILNEIIETTNVATLIREIERLKHE